MKKSYLAALIVMVSLSACLPSRFVWYNFANIGDHRIFPSRSLSPSPTPHQFKRSTTPQGPKTISIGDKKNQPFEKVLKDSKTVAFLVIRNDSILYDHYTNGHSAKAISASFSMAKSVTSMLIGIAIQEGKIKSVKDPVTNYLPELKENGFEQVTIEHLLQMTSGLKYTESYYSPFSDAAKQYYGLNLRKHALRSKLKSEPGKQFKYASGTTQLLGQVLERAIAPQTITSYLQEKVWHPAGMNSAGSWSIDQKKDGMEKTFCCINATAEDFARLGRVFLYEGAPDGRQIVSADWVKASTIVDSTHGSVWYYQYQWWIGSETNGDYYMNGHLGQFVYVYPKKNLMMVRLGEKEGGIPWEPLLRKLTEVY
jgi:CubicO group peptidase (beta-lactamase class C family)